MTKAIRHGIVLVPNWIGDAVMCTPALRALHRRFPEAEFTIVGRASVCGLLDGLPGYSRFVTLPLRPSFSELRRIGASLKPAAADLAVIFPHSFRAALLAWFAGAQRRVGQARNGRSLLLTDRVQPYHENGRITPIYMTDEYLDLISILGCEDDQEGLELHAPPEAIETVRTHITGQGPLIGIAPGAGFGPSKQWYPDRFAQVADALAERIGARCVLITGPGEEKTRDTVRAAAHVPLISCDNDSPTPALLKATISQLDLLVCNDSGTRHVAVAFKVPTVCIMGPTSPRYSSGTYETGTIISANVDCAPCQKPTCKTDHRCMTRITPDIVIEAVLENLPT